MALIQRLLKMQNAGLVLEEYDYFDIKKLKAAIDLSSPDADDVVQLVNRMQDLHDAKREFDTLILELNSKYGMN